MFVNHHIPIVRTSAPFVDRLPRFDLPFGRLSLFFRSLSFGGLFFELPNELGIALSRVVKIVLSRLSSGAHRSILGCVKSHPAIFEQGFFRASLSGYGFSQACSTGILNSGALNTITLC